MNHQTIQTIGTVIKKEKLASVDIETPGHALILESLAPYPGYHGTTIPDRLEPDSLFAVLKIMYNDERIFRTIQSIKKEHPLTFDATPGTVMLQNKAVHVLRFRQVSYNALPEIIGLFRDHGIEFVKAKKVASYESIIRIRKFFKMEKISECVYRDLTNKETYYIEVPTQMRWVTFEKVTMHLKYNLEDNKFDAAQTSIFTEEGMMDLVRIYDFNCNPAKLEFIRSQYLDAISKL